MNRILILPQIKFFYLTKAPASAEAHVQKGMNERKELFTCSLPVVYHEVVTELRNKFEQKVKIHGKVKSRKIFSNRPDCVIL